MQTKLLNFITAEISGSWPEQLESYGRVANTNSMQPDSITSYSGTLRMAAASVCLRKLHVQRGPCVFVEDESRAHLCSPWSDSEASGLSVFSRYSSHRTFR